MLALARVQRRFRLVEAERFLATFSTDRSHMRSEEGWIALPPSWDPPQAHVGAMNLFDFVDMESGFEGEVLSLAELRERETAPA